MNDETPTVNNEQNRQLRVTPDREVEEDESNLLEENETDFDVSGTVRVNLDNALQQRDTESKKLRMQELMYDECDGMRVCENVKSGIKVSISERLLKGLKFLPSSGVAYSRPDFVRNKGSMVGLCNWLLDDMNYSYTWDNKVRFWITYSQYIRKQVTNHRTNVTTKLKEKFLKVANKGK